jgi:hypothetical protein
LTRRTEDIDDEFAELTAERSHRLGFSKTGG